MILKPSIDPSSKEFAGNRKALLDSVAFLKKQSQWAFEQTCRTAGNKLSLRQRIELLKDPGTEMLELSPLAGRDVYGPSSPSGAGLITGAAPVKGRECVIIANNPAVKGGAYYPLTVKKHLRAQEIALQNGLDCIYLVDSGGAFLPLQAELFPDKDHFGRIFHNQALMSAQGLSQIAVVLGHCVAGGAYVPAMSDENIIARGQGAIFLGGPILVEAATGERAQAEELGGADMHCRISGLGDHLAETEEEALAKARQIIARLKPYKQKAEPQRSAKKPIYPTADLYGMIPFDLKTPMNMKNILAYIIDGSEWEEFKPQYGTSLLTGWAYIYGFLTGIVANNGALVSESALKGTHFIDLCDQRGIPLIFIQNVAGFMVGEKYERAGIAKDGAKMVSAVSLARVPKITLIAGGSFGAGNYGMCGRAFDPRFLWTWPSSRIAVMGGPQAGHVLASLKKKSGESQAEIKKSIQEQYRKQSDPYFATARLWDDGLIDPLDTRKILAMSLSLACGKPQAPKRKGLYRM